MLSNRDEVTYLFPIPYSLFLYFYKVYLYYRILQAQIDFGHPGTRPAAQNRFPAVQLHQPLVKVYVRSKVMNT